MNSYGLTAHQEARLYNLLATLEENRFFVLTGGAGVGKTFVLKHFINEINFPAGSIVCAAPTNKAVAVLTGTIGFNAGADFQTIHSLLGIKPCYDEETGEVSFKPIRNDKQDRLLKTVKLLIIDECSMLASELIQYIFESAMRYSFKVLFVGDNKQLNPVNEKNSRIFQLNLPTVELEEVVRQAAGNPIVHLSRNLHLLYKRKSNMLNGVGYLFTKNFNKVLSSLRNQDTDDSYRYIAWTNTNVNMINRIVRDLVYGKDAESIAVGEIIIFNKPYKQFYYTNEEVRVMDYELRDMEFKIYSDTLSDADAIKQKLSNVQRFLVYHVKLIGRIEPIIILHDSEQSNFKRTRKIIFNLCKEKRLNWKFYFNFTEQFAEFSYAYAITVHKAQGSTYRNVIINLDDMMRNGNRIERERLLYTAVTRASNRLIIYSKN